MLHELVTGNVSKMLFTCVLGSLCVVCCFLVCLLVYLLACLWVSLFFDVSLLVCGALLVFLVRYKGCWFLLASF